jgi:CTP-dependent riboflavin kinase
MDLKNWCEYMRDVKELAHLTNAYIANEADVSIKTVERIMALDDEKDIMRATARRIELVVIGPVGKHICELDYNDSSAADRINSLLAEVEYWRKENDRKAKIIDKYLD